MARRTFLATVVWRRVTSCATESRIEFELPEMFVYTAAATDRPEVKA